VVYVYVYILVEDIKTIKRELDGRSRRVERGEGKKETGMR